MRWAQYQFLRMLEQVSLKPGREIAGEGDEWLLQHLRPRDALVRRKREILVVNANALLDNFTVDAKNKDCHQHGPCRHQKERFCF